jgi:ketosteroid isomerase-like protein
MNVSEQVRVAMRQTNELFNTEIVKNGNIGALDSIYTPDARILPPGTAMIEGLENIKTFWQQAIAAMSIKAATLSTVHAEYLGDRVFEIGRADLNLADGQTVTVKYVVLWKRESGKWKWHVDIWNPNQ